MKEKDLDKNLDNLIIDGLIKEAEQDNADFEAAMRRISDAEFDAIVLDPAVAKENSHSAYIEESRYIEFSKVTDSGSRINSKLIIPKKSLPVHAGDKEDFSMIEPPVSAPVSPPGKSKKLRWKILRPWVISAISAVAIILLILIPSVNSMNDRLCEGALYASEAYIMPSKGAFEIYSAAQEEIKSQLPAIEKRYEECKDENDDSLKEAGWNLTVAYLKLNRRSDAVKILSELAVRYDDTDFGKHCGKLLKQLD